MGNFILYKQDHKYKYKLLSNLLKINIIFLYKKNNFKKIIIFYLLIILNFI